jgi:hypothetical protein
MQLIGPNAAASEVLVYYSGHGMPEDDSAYLLPTNGYPLDMKRKHFIASPKPAWPAVGELLAGWRQRPHPSACSAGRKPQAPTRDQPLHRVGLL